ncbi:MAG: response regulator [Roseiflexaceae bacterium]
MQDPPHILIVDADQSAARVTKTLVERVDPHATLVIETSAERGRISALEHQPDILIIDPSTYNHAADEQLIRQVKAHLPTARVIVLASAPTLTLRRRMLQIGADLYLEKPTATVPLIEGLRSILITTSTQ